MAQLTNPVVLEHPYLAEGVDIIDPATHQVLDLEVLHEAFDPSTKTFGGFATLTKNSTRDYRCAFEIFLALAVLALRLSQRRNPQIREVRLLYYAIIKPSTYCSMVMKKKTPSNHMGKGYHSHLLRLVTTKPSNPHEPLAHTFANMLKVLLTQADRIQAETDAKKRKHTDSDEDIPMDNAELEEVRRLKRESYGVSDVHTLPKFVNDPRVGMSRTGPTVPDRYTFLPTLSSSRWRELVENLYGEVSAVLPYDADDINDETNPYNPAMVFSPRLAFVRRWELLRADESYKSASYKQYCKSFDPKLTKDRKLQEEIRLDRWYTWGHNQPMWIKNGMAKEFNLVGMSCYGTPYQGETCWLLSIPHFGPDTFVNRLFPWATSHVSASNDEEARRYVGRTLLRSQYPNHMLTGEEQRRMDVVAHTDRAGVEKQFRHRVNQRPMLAAGYTKKRWCEDCKIARQADEESLAKEFPATDPGVAEARVLKSTQMLLETKTHNLERFIESIFTTEPSNSKAGRALVKWFEDRRRKCKDQGVPFSLSFPHDYAHSNLSSFGNMVASFCKELSDLLFVHAGHETIVRGIMASLQLHLRENMPLHQIQWSTDGGPGKSFIQETMLKHLVVDTYMRIDTLTPMVFTASDQPKDEDGYINYLDGTMIAQDELQPGLVGSANNKGSKPDDQKLAALFKSILSKSVYEHLSCLYKSGEADRAMGRILAYVRMCLQANSNDPPSSLPHPIRTRVYMQHAPFVGREMTELTGGPIGKMDNAEHQSADDRKRCQTHLDRAHRNQMLAYVIGCQIEAGNITRINTSVLTAIWRWLSDVQSDERFSLSGLEQPRMFGLAQAHTQALVLWDAFDQVFDVPNAPLYNAEWRWEYLFTFIEPRLVALTEHVTMSFGLMRNRFENIEYLQTKDLLYKWLRVQHDSWTQGGERRRRARLLEEADNERGRQPKPIAKWVSEDPRDEVVMHTFPCHPDHPDVVWMIAEVSNPDFLHGIESRRKKGGDDQRWQLVKMANALLDFDQTHRLYPSLRLESVQRTLEEMLHTQVSVPSWVTSSLSGRDWIKDHTFTQNRAQLGITGGNNRMFKIAIPILFPLDSLKAGCAVTNTCLKDALQYVIQTPNCTGRDLVYGATESCMSDVWQTISLQSQDQLIASRTRLKPSHNVILRDEFGKPLPEGHEIMGDIDTYFLERFDIDHRFTKFIRNIYPSRDPVHGMMELWWYTKVPYDLQPPYPMHHEAYFQGALRVRRDAIVARNLVTRQRLLLEGGEEDDHEREDRIDAAISERRRVEAESCAILKRGWTYPVLPRETFDGKDVYTQRISPWLKFLVNKRKDVSTRVTSWLTGTETLDWNEAGTNTWTIVRPYEPEFKSDDKSTKEFPKHVISPITRLRLSNQEQDIERYRFMRQFWVRRMVTLRKCTPDSAQHTITINDCVGGPTQWRIVGGYLQMPENTRLALMPPDQEIDDAEMARAEQSVSSADTLTVWRS